MPWVPGLTVRIFTHEGARGPHGPLVGALEDLVRREGLAGLTITRAFEGMRQHGASRFATNSDARDDLPLVIEIVDRSECVEPLLGEIAALVTSGTLTVTDARVYFPASQLVVRDVMVDPRFTARAETPLAEVLLALVEGGARLVPVVAADKTLQGVITLSNLLDVLDPALAAHLAEQQTAEQIRHHLQQLAEGKTARDGMLTSVAVLHPTLNIEGAARYLAAHQVTRVPVVDDRRRVVGMVGEHQLVAALVAPLRTDGTREDAQASALLRGSVGARAGGPLSAGSLAVRDVPQVQRTAHGNEVVRAVEACPSNVALVVDHDGRLAGLIDERAILQRAVPDVHEGVGSWVSHLFSRSSLDVVSLLRRGGARTLTAEALMRPARPVVAEATPVAEALAEMLNAGHSDLAVVVTPDQHPVGILWRQDALHSLVGR
jgi:CBS domain-containing protein